MNKTLLILFSTLCLLLLGTNAQFPIEARINNGLLPQGFVAWRFAEGLNRPRQITRLPGTSDLLVLETRPNAGITLLFDSNNDGINDASERVVLVNGNSSALPQTNLALTHAVLYRNGYIYASSDTTVYRWPYTPGSRSPITAAPEVLITGIPAGGRHSTRTLEFDSFGRLYVQLGSRVDIASDTSRDRIHRFAASNFDGSAPLTAPLDYYANGTLYAGGLRNHVAFRFDPQGRALGVEQGRDVTSRNDLGGDISFSNPAEEFNVFPTVTASETISVPNFYGYPFCWTEFALNITDGPQIPHQRGTQWADTNFLNDGVHTDQWCRDPNTNVAPVYGFDPHSAALDIVYYNPGANTTSGQRQAFGSSSSEYQGVAFIAQHGSHTYIRDPLNTGYQIVSVRYEGNAQGTINVSSVESFFRAQGPGYFPDDLWWRPTGLTFGDCPNGAGDCLYMTADGNNTVLAFGYYPDRYVANEEIPLVLTPSPSPCPSVSACPTLTASPVPTVSPSPSPACPNDNNNGGTNINFYFDGMLNGVNRS